MIDDGLELISPELSRRFKRASNLQLRVCALAACRFALDQTGLENPVINEGLRKFQNLKPPKTIVTLYPLPASPC
ncbi:hypothetical protein QUF63_09840 [Anaerolineales bacterium HSG25]|nr:hypothetical protein [Anaerolineales bacterium HSG25]